MSDLPTNEEIGDFTDPFLNGVVVEGLLCGNSSTLLCHSSFTTHCTADRHILSDSCPGRMYVPVSQAHSVELSERLTCSIVGRAASEKSEQRILFLFTGHHVDIRHHNLLF